MLDLDRYEDPDVYGEIRLIHQTPTELRLTMVDYGIAWAAGEFRDVVRIIPWTFRFDRWGPRRGPADSKQPRTRAGWEADRLVLEKRTATGNGEFDWKWQLRDDRIVPLETADAASFLRSAADDPALKSLDQRLPRKGPGALSRSRLCTHHVGQPCRRAGLSP